MAYSDEFIRQIVKRSSEESIKTVVVRKFLFDFLGGLPEELRWDIFNLFFSDTTDETYLVSKDAQRLSEVIDLFEGEYEMDELNISDDELKYISEGVNDYALELSDDVLMNVMQAVVARGLIK